MELVTLDLKTGEVKKFNQSRAWLNHVQFSPTDPHQMLFCHEGTWQLMDRTWIIRTDGSGLTNVHPRTMNMEINGHEFFSPDGKSILYDLQTPRSRVFWVARYDIETKARPGTTSSRTSGRCISTSRRTRSFSVATGAGRAVSPPRTTASGSISFART